MNKKKMKKREKKEKDMTVNRIIKALINIKAS